MQIYDPAEWSRAGWGRELQFFAADAELKRWLCELPEQYAPYTIWGSHLVKANGHHERVLFCYPLDEWGHHVADMHEQFFVHTSTLMPQLPVHEDAARRATEWGSLNGLVLVQHGAKRSGRQLASRIAVTDKIKNRATGHVVSLKDRAVVFEALRAIVDANLRFTSVQVFKDGHEEEDASQLMTAAAAKQAAEGRLVRRPGRQLDR